jgi:nucleotide-binding universal stress UspA family protein
MVSNSHYGQVVAGQGGAGRVVAGWDGRWQTRHLLEVAAAEAVRLGRPLSIVTLIHSPDEVASTEGHPADGWQAKKTAGHWLEPAAESLRQRYEDLRVATQCIWFADVAIAAEPFASAVLLVVGDCDRHGNPAFLPESASQRLLDATDCDVLEVPLQEGPEQTLSEDRNLVRRSG